MCVCVYVCVRARECVCMFVLRWWFHQHCSIAARQEADEGCLCLFMLFMFSFSEEEGTCPVCIVCACAGDSQRQPGHSPVVGL